MSRQLRLTLTEAQYRALADAVNHRNVEDETGYPLDRREAGQARARVGGWEHLASAWHCAAGPTYRRTPPEVPGDPHNTGP